MRCVHMIMTQLKSSAFYTLAPVLAAMASTTACMHSAADSPVIASAKLSSAQSQPIGTVSIRNDAEGPMMSVDVTGLAPGIYGMHFHQTGKCDAPGFTTAGSHWNPAGRKHGLSNVNGPHAGDLPNIEVKSGGNAISMVPLSLSLIDGPQSLFDADGAAIVIHARADDNITDPSGNSGDRILCGVLRRE